MDFLSGIHWIKMNDILKDNFQDFVRDEDQVNSTLISWIQLVTSALSSFNLLFCGSVAEGTFMNPVLRENGWEVDVMFMLPDFVMSRDRQDQMFEHVPDEPGYVRLQADLLSTPISQVLKVKEVKHRNGHSHRYLTTVSNDSDEIPELPSEFDFFQSGIFDLQQLSCADWKESWNGPAFTGVLKCFSPIFNSKKQPTYLEFVNDLGTQFVQRLLNESSSESDTDSSDEEPQTAPNKFGDNYKVDFLQDQSPDDFLLTMKIDLVPAIECEGWPEIESSFFSRTRIWPSTSTLNSLRAQGFHLVYKPLDLQSPDSVEWRISFSKAEMTLFHSMDGFRIYCYRVFKTIYYCELTLPKVLCSYHMKTIFLWACERIPPEFWVEENLAQIIMGLLDDLLHCLVTKTCPHYFIPENNLFAHVHGDFLDHLAKVVSKIRKNPERYPLTKSYMYCNQNQTDNTAHNEITEKQDIPLD